jgi:hypothetical protein
MIALLESELRGEAVRGDIDEDAPPAPVCGPMLFGGTVADAVRSHLPWCDGCPAGFRKFRNTLCARSWVRRFHDSCDCRPRYNARVCPHAAGGDRCWRDNRHDVLCTSRRRYRLQVLLTRPECEHHQSSRIANFCLHTKIGEASLRWSWRNYAGLWLSYTLRVAATIVTGCYWHCCRTYVYALGLDLFVYAAYIGWRARRLPWWHTHLSVILAF